jgi:outer membrane murein-binding lipoprotein Lpp
MISFRHTLSLAMVLLLQACTVLSQGQSTQIETRIQQLRTEVAEMKSEFERTRETLQARSAETEQGDGMLAKPKSCAKNPLRQKQRRPWVKAWLAKRSESCLIHRARSS